MIVDWPVKMRAPDCVATPGKIIRKLVPSDEICAWIAACAPCPTPIIAMTQATPMMMPSAVRTERILLRAIAFSPTLRIVRNFSMRPQASAAAPRRGAAPTGRSSTIRPSRKTTTRCACSAMSGSCVISTTVLPSSFSLWKTRHDLLGGLRVEVARRLVGQDELRVVDQRPRDRDALLLAARELARLVVLAARRAPRSRRHRRAFSSRSRARVAVGGVDQRQLDVLERRGAGEQVEGLEHEADLPVADLGALVAVEPRDVDAVEEVAARRRPVEAADDVHERALAGARRAHDRDELARRDRERDAVERAHLDLAHLVDPDEVLDPDDVGHAQKASGPPPGRRRRRRHGRPRRGVGLGRHEADDDGVARLELARRRPA